MKPSIDETDEGRPLSRAQHGRPVVNTSSGRKHGTDLGERGGDAQRDEGDEDPAPEDGDGLAVCEGDVHGGGQAVGDGHDGKGQAENAEHAEVPGEFCLVAEAGQCLVGLV